MPNKLQYDPFLSTEPPSGEEGNEQVDEFLGKPDLQDIPVDSKKSLEEQKVLQEAKDPKNQVPTDKKDPSKPDQTQPEEKKKKEGLFKKLFGKKNKDGE
jgi:penicillin-binding protein 1A